MAAPSLHERTLAMLAEIGRGKVRTGWDANDQPVTYIAGQRATAAQITGIQRLLRDRTVCKNDEGQYELTATGEDYLTRHYPTWK